MFSLLKVLAEFLSQKGRPKISKPNLMIRTVRVLPIQRFRFLGDNFSKTSLIFTFKKIVFWFYTDYIVKKFSNGRNNLRIDKMFCFSFLKVDHLLQI